MRRASVIILMLAAVLMWYSCKENFDPQLKLQQTNYLVVEGFINANGPTKILLSRTVPLKDTATIKPELKAQVTILAQDNTVYNVKETGNGSYQSDSLILSLNQKYRLHIKTATGGEYYSEFVAVKQTPPIDSVNWKVENNGVQIYVNTHDPQDSTRYYKWNYEETWEIHSAFFTYYKYVNGVVLPRDQSEIPKLYYCWKAQNSTSIILGSSAQLTKDVINLAPVLFIPIESEKLGVRYSILVKQYSLDAKSYEFYKLMKSNTESLGSVFDRLPSDFPGNITCVNNPAEKVIGFITASTISQKRIFILSSDVNSKYFQSCSTKFVTPDSIKYYFGGSGYWPYQSEGTPPGPVKGYYSATASCLDCSYSGSNVKPSFW